MREENKKDEPFQSDHADKSRAKQPVDRVARIIRVVSIALIFVNVLLVGLPILLGSTNRLDLFSRVGEFSLAHMVASPSFLIGVGMLSGAIVAYFVRRRVYAGLLFRWGLAVGTVAFMSWLVVSLLTTTIEKPVIYLYPETTTDVAVRLDYHGTLIADYPPYDEALHGWRVTAEPDGTLTNHADGKEYSYLFWEGMPETSIDWNLTTGFVVAGSDTRAFLQEKLAEIGLTPKEYNEFIVYWYPKMKDNPYNLIHFADTQYTDTAPLTITPAPDSMLRVFMVYKPLARPIDLVPQTFTPFTRTGFTVVEWGGTEVE